MITMSTPIANTRVTSELVPMLRSVLTFQNDGVTSRIKNPKRMMLTQARLRYSGDAAWPRLNR